MTVTAKITGADKVKRKLRHVPTAVEMAMREQLFEAAKEIKAEVIREIEKPKSGRVYTRTRRNKSKITWRASAPGEAPAKKTGERMAKIVAKKQNRKLKPQSRVTAPGIYRLLERGLPNIAPRPLFGPLMRKRAPEIVKNLKIGALRKVKEVMKR